MMKMDPELNVYGDPIEPCSFSPLTGFSGTDIAIPAKRIREVIPSVP